MCKENVSLQHEERSLVQEEPEAPPQIKEEQDDLVRLGEADSLLIIDVRSLAPSGKNVITADVNTLTFWSVDFHQIKKKNMCFLSVHFI